MAQLAVTIAGGIVGSFFGMPQLGLLVGGLLGNALFAPTVQGPRLTDLTVTVSSYGNAINYLFGTCRMNGNVIWSTKIKETEHRNRVGKGGQSSTSYTYSASFAVAFCTGPANAVTRIWADSKLIYGNSSSQLLNSRDLNAEHDLGQQILQNATKNSPAEFANVKFRFYPGTETQLPDGLIEAAVGADKTPAYRGLCYIVFEDLQLVDFGNRIPSITAEITKIPASAAPNMTPIFGDVVPSDSGSLVDWQGNLMYMWDNSNTLFSYDLTTMRQVKAVRLPYRPRGYTANGGPMYSTTPGGNSGPMAIMDPDTGATSLFGRSPSNFLGDSPAGDCTVYAPDTPRFENGDGQIVGFYTQDQYGARTDYFIHLAGFGSISMYTAGGSWVLDGPNPLRAAGDSGIGEAVACAIPGSATEVILWKTRNNGLVYQRYRVNPGVAGTVLTAYKADLACTGSVFIPPSQDDLYQEFVTLGAVTVKVSLSVETIKTFDTSGDYVTIQTITRDQYGHETITYSTRRKNNLDAAGSVFTYPQTTTTYDSFAPYFVIIDPTDGTLNMVGDYRKDGVVVKGFLRWSLAERAVKVARVWNLPSDNGGYPIFVPYMNPYSRLRGNSIGWLSQIPDFGQKPRITTVSLVTGEITSTPFTDQNALPTIGSTANGALGGYWDDETQSLITTPFGRKATRFYFRNFGDLSSVASIVAELCDKTTVLTPDDYDISQLEDLSCVGYVVSNTSNVKDCLAQLSQTFFFDAVESDFKIKFVQRGSAPALTIPEDYLGIADSHTMSAVKETITQEFELPMKITMNYYSFERDYQTGSMFSKRMVNPVPTMFSPVQNKYELPIVMTAVQAKQITDKALQTAWAGRSSINLVLPWKYLAIDPTDVISVSLNNGIQYRLRTEKMDMGVDYTLQATLVSDSAASYVSLVTTGTDDFPSQTVRSPGKAVPILVNTPLLRDMDDTQGNGSLYYYGYSLPSGGYSKGVLLEASPNGYNYAVVDSLANEMTTGTMMTTLPSVVYGEATDEHTVIRVALSPNSASLESITQDEMLAGGNPALVGNEVIQFRDAVQDDHGIWTLKGILRGRRGTQYAIAGHKANETFVLLTPATLGSALRDSSNYNRKLTFIAVNNGTVPSDAKPVSANLEPNDLKPYTPEAVKAASTGGLVTVNFQRRSRKTFGIVDAAVNAPYAEGQGPSASFKWQVFYDAEIDDPAIRAGTKTPDGEGQVMIYNPDGTFAPLSFTVPYVQPDPFTGALGAGLTATTYSSFVAKIWEVGYVDGFPKIVKLTAPIAPNGNKTDGTWAYAELY